VDRTGGDQRWTAAGETIHLRVEQRRCRGRESRRAELEDQRGEDAGWRTTDAEG
jgi:hypothetical protein